MILLITKLVVLVLHFPPYCQGDYFGCAVVELLADVGSSVVIFLQQRMMAVADDDVSIHGMLARIGPVPVY